MTTWKTQHLEVIAKMVRPPVVKSHHKQRQTIIGWCNGFDGDVLSDAIDDLVTDPSAPVYETGRDTIYLESVHAAKDFLEEHDDEDEYTWFV